MSNCTVTLAIDKGSFGHVSVSINQLDENGNGTGTRIAGPKCWGGGRPMHEFVLGKRDLEGIIEACLCGISTLEEQEKIAQFKGGTNADT